MKKHDCDECHAFESAQPLAELRTPVPLRNADFAAIRARVMSEVAQPRRAWFPFALRLAFAIALVVLIGLGVFVRTRPAPRPAHRVVPVAKITAPAPLPLAPIAAPPPSQITESVPTPAARVARHRPARAKRIEAAPDEEMRIHIQTADPDVRIIWIINPNPKEESES